MIGCYDFCGHYDWTFAWLERAGGEELVREYWKEAISHDSQRHAREMIARDGFAGMASYWGHTLAEESPERGFTVTGKPDVFRIDIHECPSKGFLLRNGLEAYRDYCDHCIGWIGPMMRDAGFVIDHEHNHCGQCWWEMRHSDSPSSSAAIGEVSGTNDVRTVPQWTPVDAILDRFRRATSAEEKQP
jgi:hypothetical protein